MTRAIFHAPEQYQATAPYRLLPFRFMRWDASTVLLVNMVGEFQFVGTEEFRGVAGRRLHPKSDTYRALKARHFLTDSPSTIPVDLLATKYRSKMSFLEGFTKLHLFVVTLRCDHSCPYCQVSRVTQDRARYDMSRETADRALDLVFQSPSPVLKIEFQGGEPLLNFDLIRHIVLEAERRNQVEQRDLEFVVATNLSNVTEEVLGFLRDHRVQVSTSLDGPAFIHDANRPRRGGSSHRAVIENLARVRTVLGADRVSALMTATELGLDHPREIVDEYRAQGFRSIFLRSISPYGFAVRTGQAWQYSAERFLRFYREGLDYILELNRAGEDFVEVYTQLVLRRILTPFSTAYVDLQSPAGAVVSVVAYNYDGSVYASDESRMLAEMHDTTFRLGSVHENTYREMFGGEVARALVASSCTDTLPGCSDCVFAPYCGADPVFHWATQGDLIGHRPTSAFCTRNMGVFRHIFGLLREADPFLMRLFASWASDRGLPTATEAAPC